jgi:hypothetical protein
MHSSRLLRRCVALVLIPVTLVLTACGQGGGEAAPTPSPTANSTARAADAYLARIDQLQTAVAVWAKAESLDEAQRAAELAANLVVGPAGPGYGDRNGDSVIAEVSDAGLLPGLEGTPAGLALPLVGVGCIDRDVLGGDWTDPAAAWQAMATAIAAWSADNNTMPTLRSHPMRIVGWATLTLATESPGVAHEYAGHAQLHVDVARDALTC